MQESEFLESLKEIRFANRAQMETVIEWLEDYIKENDIPIGGLLPFEKEIIEQCGVSHSCVRETMTALRTLGIIDSRRRVGTVLKRPLELHHIARLFNAHTMPPQVLGYIGGIRNALEYGLSHEVFERCTDEDIIELERICQGMDEKTIKRADFIASEIKFHRKLISITGNQIALWMLDMMAPHFSDISPTPMPISDDIVGMHIRLVDALKQRDKEGFLREAEKHYLHKVSWDSQRYSK